MIPAPLITPALFSATAILWGSSAIVTRSQAFAGPPEYSVVFRMLIVSLVMFGYCHLTKTSKTVSRDNWAGLLFQGVFFFGFGFVIFYHSTLYIPSGISALLLSFSSVIAAIVGWACLSKPISRRKAAGIGIGIAGLFLLVLPQILGARATELSLFGLGLAGCAAMSTGLGTVFAARNQSRGVPIATCMAWGALAGAIAALTWALTRGVLFEFAFSPIYFAGLAYLAIIASCLAFFMYFNLVDRIGPGSAASTLATVPLIAILISMLFEGLGPSWNLVFGGLAILFGNTLVMIDPKPAADGSQSRRLSVVATGAAASHGTATEEGHTAHQGRNR
jgi:drug/metabolite transporter (DMT)-like permease